MDYYCFRTFRTSYYFPLLDDSHSFLYHLYTPFGKISRIYWWLFRQSYLVRWLNKISDIDSVFPYTKIMGLMPSGSRVSFNMGTPSDEQKISMLGEEPDGKRFFAKYSQKPRAIELSKNEIGILSNLTGSGLAPELYDHLIADDFCFFRTSFVDGRNNTYLQLNDAIVDLAIRISKTHLHQANGEGGLMTGLSHGDYTPWNMLILDGQIRLIDWEYGGIRFLGYDLFTFITQVCAFFKHRKSFKDAVAENTQYLNQYFYSYGIMDWTPYLVSFANIKMEYESNRGYSSFAEKYKCLL